MFSSSRIDWKSIAAGGVTIVRADITQVRAAAADARRCARPPGSVCEDRRPLVNTAPPVRRNSRWPLCTVISSPTCWA